MIDIESEIRSALAETADTTEIPTFPGLDAMRTVPARRLRRRFGAAAAATCLVLGSGVGVAAAAAAGVFTDPPPIGQDGFGVPGLARTVLAVRGPQGSTLTLRILDSRGGTYCSELSGMPGRQTSIASCGEAVTSFGRLDEIADATSAQTVGLGPTEFSATVPGATTVKVSFDDGTSRPLAVAHDFTIGWFTDAQSLEHPELIGYDANGAVIGRTNLISAAEHQGLTCRQHC